MVFPQRGISLGRERERGVDVAIKFPKVMDGVMGLCLPGQAPGEALPAIFWELQRASAWSVIYAGRSSEK